MHISLTRVNNYLSIDKQNVSGRRDHQMGIWNAEEPPSRSFRCEAAQQSARASADSRAAEAGPVGAGSHHRARGGVLFRRARVRGSDPRTRETTAHHAAPALPLLSEQGSS